MAKFFKLANDSFVNVDRIEHVLFRSPAQQLSMIGACDISFEDEETPSISLDEKDAQRFKAYLEASQAQ